MSFADLTGNAAVAGTHLQRSLQHGRLAHAYLFTGARGSGKQDLARALAQAINCTGREHDACGQCESCRLIAKRQHPDVYWVGPESKSRRIMVDQIRELERSIVLKATMARLKVGIITDAECLNEQAQNAFLKTLEEPPARTIIILLSAEPQRLLPTILSRCLRVSFGPNLQAENPWRAKVLPLLMVFAAEPRPGVVHAYRLQTALTGLLAETRNNIRERIEAEDDLDRYTELDARSRERLEDQREARIEGEYRGAREEILEEIYTWFSDVLLSVEAAPPSLLSHPEQLEVLRQAARGKSYRVAADHLEAIDQIRLALARNISEPFALEVGLLKLLGS
jgi:DNA polymerase-3 subunit delta'